jgi:hypothetical protein
MSAKHKLNAANAGGSILLAALIFLMAAALLLTLQYHTGEIRR